MKSDFLAFFPGFLKRITQLSENSVKDHMKNINKYGKPKAIRFRIWSIVNNFVNKRENHKDMSKI